MGETYLIYGQLAWGRGSTLDAAKRQFRNAGGRLGLGYTILLFDKDTKVGGVSGVGSVSYEGNAPTRTVVKSRV